MSFFPGTESVRIRSYIADEHADDYGNPTYTMSVRTVRNCLVATGATSQPESVDREPIEARLTIYFPNGTKILDSDRFELRGSEWEKEGEALQWTTPFTDWETSVIVEVRRVRG